jgi:hypothetical protein
MIDVRESETALSETAAKAAAKVTRVAGTTEARIAEKDADSARRLRERQAEVELKRQAAELKREQATAKADAKSTRKVAAAKCRQDRRRARAERFTKAIARVQTFIAGNAPAVYSSGIYAMALYVAVAGQISMATERGWPLVVGIGMAVFLEGLALSMALTAHQLRLKGERALIPAAMTWVAAGFASAINVVAHREDPVMAAVLGASSLAAIIVWEVRSGAKHRDALRKLGLVPDPPERFGLRRWLRFPRSTFRAWSLDVRDRVSDGAAVLLARVETAVQDAAAASSAESAAAALAAAVEAAETAARESGRARAAAAEAHRAASQADAPKRARWSLFKRTAAADAPAPAAARAVPPAPASKPAAAAKAPARPAPTAAPTEADAAPAPRPAVSAVDFTVVEDAFVELFVQNGKRPGSRLIERAVKGKPDAPRKTAIGDWLSRNPDSIIDTLTARAEARLAARSTTEGPSA